VIARLVPKRDAQIRRGIEKRFRAPVGRKNRLIGSLTSSYPQDMFETLSFTRPLQMICLRVGMVDMLYCSAGVLSLLSLG